MSIENKKYLTIAFFPRAQLIRTTFYTRFDTNIRKDDKNVFEMKYSGATINSTSPAGGEKSKKLAAGNELKPPATPRPSEDLSTHSSDLLLSSGRSSQQRLFTIDGKCE